MFIPSRKAAKLLSLHPHTLRKYADKSQGNSIYACPRNKPSTGSPKTKGRWSLSIQGPPIGPARSNRI